MSIARRLVLLAGVLAAGAVAVVLLYPTLVAPTTGDDRYYYLQTAAQEDWSTWDMVGQTPEIFSRRVEYGRANALTAVERKVAARAVVDTAVALDKPITWVVGFLKLGLAAVSLLCVVALVRALRWRTRSGTLVRATGSSLAVLGAVGAMAFAAGAQPQLTGASGLNGWISYPVSTWSAPASVFGVTALVLWLARLSAERGPWVKAGSAVVLVLLGLVTNLRYELVFPAVPLALLALLVVPVTDREHRREGRRAKWLTGLAYAVGFFPVFVAVRLHLRAVCAQQDCYRGVELGLDADAVRSLWINTVSPVPGTGRRHVRELLDRHGMDLTGVWTPTATSVAIALFAVVLVLVLARLAGPRGRGVGEGDDERRARATLHLVGACLLLVGAGGTAVLMSLSAGAQAGVDSVGILYRHAVLAWLAYSAAAVLLAQACAYRWPRAGLAPWAALAVLLAGVVMTQVPANARALEADRAELRLSERVNWQTVHGDLDPAADQRRCETAAAVRARIADPPARLMLNGADRTFRRLWDQPFCTEPPGDG